MKHKKQTNKQTNKQASYSLEYAVLEDTIWHNIAQAVSTSKGLHIVPCCHYKCCHTIA